MKGEGEMTCGEGRVRFALLMQALIESIRVPFFYIPSLGWLMLERCPKPRKGKTGSPCPRRALATVS